VNIFWKPYFRWVSVLVKAYCYDISLRTFSLIQCTFCTSDSEKFWKKYEANNSRAPARQQQQVRHNSSAPVNSRDARNININMEKHQRKPTTAGTPEPMETPVAELRDVSSSRGANTGCQQQQKLQQYRDTRNADGGVSSNSRGNWNITGHQQGM
jgi:hypothetical protein